MSVKKIILVMLMAVLCTAALTAGGASEDASGKKDVQDSSEITITDAIGREVTIRQPVKRIAFINSTTGEMIKIVGAWDRVVAVDWENTNEMLYPGVSGLPVINSLSSGSQWDIDFEKLIETKPDILLTVHIPMPGFEDMAAKLEPEIPVFVVLDPTDPDAWTKGAKLLGQLLNQEKEAEEFCLWYDGLVKKISERTKKLPDNQKPRVFMKTLGMSPDQLCTYTDEFGFIKRLFEVSGGINIAADAVSTGGWVQNVDPEWLVEQNPEIIMAAVGNFYYPNIIGFEVDDSSVADQARNDIIASAVLGNTMASDNRRVYVFDTHFTVTPRIPVLMTFWAKCFHPEHFTDLDLNAVYQEYLNRFFRIDYDLEKNGVFFYPEP